jgi:hypothetical protein
MDVCKTVVPLPEEVAPGHRVACHLVSPASSRTEAHGVAI